MRMKEAIDIVKAGEKGGVDAKKWKKAIDKLIGRQEERMVNYEGDGYADGEMVYDIAYCPECGREFEYGTETWEEKYCPRCGQRLKWETEDEQEG